MFIRRVLKPNDHISIRIVHSIRRGDKVRQETICCIGHAHKDDLKKIEKLDKLAEEILVKCKNEFDPVFPGMEEFAHFPRKKRTKPTPDDSVEKINFKTIEEEKRINNGIDDIFGSIFKQMSLDLVFENKKPLKKLLKQDVEINFTTLNSILRDVVLSRIADPFSKRKTSKILERDYGKQIPLQKIYRMMDELVKKEERIKNLVLNNTLTLFDDQVDILFFDVTTLYFESTEQDELRNHGFSKDCKFKEVQIVLALVTTTEGLPIFYKEFPGNTSEGKTLITIIKDIKDKFPKIRDVVLVADRAMFTEDNLQMLESENINYVVAARLKRLPANIRNKILSDQFLPTVIENEFQWVQEYGYKNNRRLMISYSSKRAMKDSADRNRLVDRLIKKEKNGKINISSLVTNIGSRKYVSKIEGNVVINQPKIEADEKWDGLHGIITNVKDESIENLLSRYRSLWQIEAAFRMNKHDLKMRPIYHWKPNRIKGHLLICYLAYALVSTVMFKLKNSGLKISFEELRDELVRVEASIIRDKCSRKRFSLPSSATEIQHKIYQSLGLVRETRIKRIFN